MDCQISTQKLDDTAVVTVSGYIDAHTFEELEEEVENLVDDNINKIAMSLSKVNYISSAGIGVLVNIQSTCQGNGGGLVLINPADCLKDVFKMFGIWDMFTVAEDQAQAMSLLNGDQTVAGTGS